MNYKEGNYNIKRRYNYLVNPEYKENKSSQFHKQCPNATIIVLLSHCYFYTFNTNVSK